MKLPKQITVGRTKYGVMVDTRPGSRLGCVYYVDKRIVLHKFDWRAKRLPQDIQDETFWHELTHAILHDMGHPLRDNEKFVSAFAARLNKAIKSAKF